MLKFLPMTKQASSSLSKASFSPICPSGAFRLVKIDVYHNGNPSAFLPRRDHFVLLWRAAVVRHFHLTKSVVMCRTTGAFSHSYTGSVESFSRRQKFKTEAGEIVREMKVNILSTAKSIGTPAWAVGFVTSFHPFQL